MLSSLVARILCANPAVCFTFLSPAVFCIFPLNPAQVWESIPQFPRPSCSWVMTSEDAASLVPLDPVQVQSEVVTSPLGPSFWSVLWVSVISLLHKYFPCSYSSVFSLSGCISPAECEGHKPLLDILLGTACRISMETVMCTSLIPSQCSASPWEVLDFGE